MLDLKDFGAKFQYFLFFQSDIRSIIGCSALSKTDVVCLRVRQIDNFWNPCADQYVPTVSWK